MNGRGSSITIAEWAWQFAYLTFDLDLCRAKKHTVVNGSRAVGGSSCGWKEQSGQTNGSIWMNGPSRKSRK